MSGANHQDTYLTAIFDIMGIKDITFLHDEKSLAGDSELPGSLERARKLAQEFAAV
jgi:FMN-dependent NADH-azoreductase